MPEKHRSLKTVHWAVRSGEDVVPTVTGGSMDRKRWIPLWTFWLAVTTTLPTAVGAQDSRTSEIIELNRRIMHEQIIERDAELFQDVALEQFLVVAPGGRIENKAEAIGGVNAWDAESIEVRDEQVIFHNNTAVLVGRLQIHGEMRPVGTLPPMKFMAVFVESLNGWKLLSRSLTPCFEMAIQHGFC